MNYTTLEKVRAALGAETVTDNAIVEVKITEASRALDRLCGAPDNYFESATVTGEQVVGLITSGGVLLCYPIKAIISSVTSFEYRLSPLDEYQTVEARNTAITNLRQVSAFGAALGQGKCFVRISYEGGYGAEEPATPEVIADPDAIPPIVGSARVPAVITGLPEDIINAATVLAVRFYKEEKSGLTDAIGVAELGMMQYTKAMPARVVEMMKPYKRIL